MKIMTRELKLTDVINMYKVFKNLNLKYFKNN